MAQNAEHREKLKEVEQRQNMYLARRVEEQDVDKRDGPTAQIAAEEQVDANPEFVVDYICYECAPSEDDRDELVTSVVDQSPKAAVSKGGKADIPSTNNSAGSSGVVFRKVHSLVVCTSGCNGRQSSHLSHGAHQALAEPPALAEPDHGVSPLPARATTDNLVFPH